MATETFKVARARLFKELEANGWRVTTFSTRTMKPLKVPYAERGWGSRIDKLWFKPQALYVSQGPAGMTVNDSRSLFDDIRGVSAAAIEARIG